MNTTDPGSTSEVWTIGKLITSAADYLKSRSIEEPRLSAEILLAHVFACSRLQLYTRWTNSVDDPRRTQLRDLIRRAASGEPVAYIVGHKEFFSMDFEVSRDVLIPRPETELLVDRVLAYVKDNPRPAWELFEPGTGSGNIGAAIIKNIPAARLLASDITEEAVAVARRNYEKHGLADRTSVTVADWMKIPADLVPAGGFDLIVANPPYVGTTQTEMVSPNVLANEPSVALFGGADGLDFYRRTTAEALPILKPDGTLFCEVGWGDVDKVVAIFAAAGWRDLGRWKDFAGIERTLQFAPPASSARLVHFRLPVVQCLRPCASKRPRDGRGGSRCARHWMVDPWTTSGSKAGPASRVGACQWCQERGPAHHGRVHPLPGRGHPPQRPRPGRHPPDDQTPRTPRGEGLAGGRHRPDAPDGPG